MMSQDKLLLVPLAFATVHTSVYRSSYPSKRVLPFLLSLNLKSMICLNPHDVRQDLREFAEQEQIRLFTFDIGINQEPFLVMSESAVRQALLAAKDPENQPTLIFCTTGKARTSCVVACLRKSADWSLSSIFHEFEQYSDPEGGAADLLFIENFSLL